MIFGGNNCSKIDLYNYSTKKIKDEIFNKFEVVDKTKVKGNIHYYNLKEVQKRSQSKKKII